MSLTKQKRRGGPCKNLAKGPLAHYQNAGLESSAEELVSIWFKDNPHSPVFKEVANDITTSGPIDSESMAISHLRMYWATESSKSTKIVWAR